MQPPTDMPDTTRREIAGIAHDLNNALSAIFAHSEAAQEAAPPGTPLLEDIRRIREAGQRAAELTRQLQELTRKSPQLIGRAHV